MIFKSAAMGCLISALVFVSPYSVIAHKGPIGFGPIPLEFLETPKDAPSDFNYHTLTAESQTAILSEDSKLVLKNEGADGLIRYLRKQADRGLNLKPLRDYTFASNNNQPRQILVEVHPKNLAAIDFANTQLKRSGIDFYEFAAQINPNLPEPSEPFKADAAAYKKWRTVRETLIPMVGFAACLIQAATQMSQNGAVTFNGMLPYLSQAFTILGLEWQFSHWSNWWNYKFWSDTRHGIPPLPEVLKTKLNGQLAGLVSLVNRSLEIVNKGIPKGIQANHIWSLTANYLYAGTVYTVGMLTAWSTGNMGFPFGFLKMLSASFLATAVFYYGFGLTQILIGQFQRNGQISEFQRFRLESIGAYWGNLGRSISLIPGLNWVGLYMMGAWGAFMTTPLLVRNWATKRYADKTKEVFERNAANDKSPVAMGACDKVLETAFNKIGFPAYHSN